MLAEKNLPFDHLTVWPPWWVHPCLRIQNTSTSNSVRKAHASIPSSG